MSCTAKWIWDRSIYSIIKPSFDMTLFQYFWRFTQNPFRGRWGQEVIFEVAEAKLLISSSSYKFSFRIFVVWGFKVVWPRQPQQPQKVLRDFFQKLHFWNQCIPRKKMRHVSAFLSKFPLNLSTEEVCQIDIRILKQKNSYQE
jgi:hypothetical protein